MNIGPEIFPSDHPLLKCISRIEHLPEEDTDNFSIKFTFIPNEYIQNDILMVKFHMMNGHDPVKTESIPILWKDGKNLFLQTVIKNQKNRNTGTIKTITKTVEAETFFNFFLPVDPSTLIETEDEV
jgi:nucleosome assembly protein 1-like 1